MPEAATLDLNAETTSDAKRPVVTQHDGHAPATGGDLTPLVMLNRAVQDGASVETLDRLMSMAERWEATRARRAFDEAVSLAKARIPVIATNQAGHNNKRYADFAALARVVDPILGEFGLSYRFRTDQDEKTISVTCILAHRDGHFEQTTLRGPHDSTGNKNAIQAIGSTLTYLQRYSLRQMLGLASGDDDDGKAASNDEKISEKQVSELRSLIVDVGADLPKLLAYLKVDTLEEIYADAFDEVKRVIEAKRGKGNGA